MTKLPRGLSGKAVVTALERTGFYFKRRKMKNRAVPFFLYTKLKAQC